MTDISSVTSVYTPPPVSATTRAVSQPVVAPEAAAPPSEPPSVTYTAISDASASTIRGVNLNISA